MAAAVSATVVVAGAAMVAVMVFISSAVGVVAESTAKIITHPTSFVKPPKSVSSQIQLVHSLNQGHTKTTQSYLPASLTPSPQNAPVGSRKPNKAPLPPLPTQ